MATVHRFRTIRKGLSAADAQRVCAEQREKHPDADIRIVLLDGGDKYNHRVLLLR